MIPSCRGPAASGRTMTEKKGGHSLQEYVHLPSLSSSRGWWFLFLQQLAARAVKCCPARKIPLPTLLLSKPVPAPHPLVCTWAHQRTKPSRSRDLQHVSLSLCCCKNDHLINYTARPRRQTEAARFEHAPRRHPRGYSLH